MPVHERDDTCWMKAVLKLSTMSTKNMMSIVQSNIVQPDRNGFSLCQGCQDFVMVGPAEISAKLTKITERVRNSRSSIPVPSPMVYRTMTKYLLYCIHASPAAPVRGKLTRMVAKKVQEEQGDFKNIAFWARSVYTPTQHSLIRSEGLR